MGPASRRATYPTKLRPEKKKHQRPEFPWTHPAQWSVGPLRQQRQNDQRHDPESHARSHAHVVDVTGQRVEPRLLDEQKRYEGEDGAGQLHRSHTCQRTGRQYDECSDLRGAVDVAPAAGDVGGRDKGHRTREQNRGRSRHAGHPEPAAESAQAAKQRERADSREPRRGTDSVSGPFAFEPDGRTTERGDQQPHDVCSVHGAVADLLSLAVDGGAVARARCHAAPAGHAAAGARRGLTGRAVFSPRQASFTGRPVRTDS